MDFEVLKDGVPLSPAFSFPQEVLFLFIFFFFFKYYLTTSQGEPCEKSVEGKRGAKMAGLIYETQTAKR